MSRQWVKVVLVGMVVAGGVVVLQWQGDPSPAAAGVTAEPLPSVAERKADRGERLPVAARLLVTVQRGGRPAAGTLIVAEGTQPATAITNMHDRSGAAEQPHAGSLELSVSPGSWCWVRADSGGATGFALVPPWSGTTTVSIDLDSAPLYVLLLDDRLMRPIVGGEVRIAVRPERPAVDAPIARRASTDLHGLARFDDLEPGSFVLLAPGARLDSGFPAAQSLLLHPGSSSRPLIVLVAPLARHRVDFDVQAVAWTPAHGRRPRLYLESADRPAELRPFPVDLAPGAMRVAMDLPDGRYRIGVVPTGIVEVHPASERITVSGPGEHLVQVAGHDRHTELRLGNVGIHQLPLQVAAWPSGAVDPPDPGLVYFGPARWRTPAATVPALGGLHRIVASGRGHVFISREDLRIAAPQVEVELVPAARITVHWDTWSEDPATHLCVARTSVGDFARTFRRRLANRPRGLCPTWSAEFVVPRESVELECTDVEGRTIWIRRVEPRSFAEFIRIDGPDG